MSRIRADQILNSAGTGAPNFSQGLQVGAATTIHTTGIDLGSGNIQSHNINSTGIITATGGTFSGNVSVGGTLTYEDVTSIDSVGIITAQAGIRVTNGRVGIGTDNPTEDLHVYTDSTGSPTIKVETMSPTGGTTLQLKGGSGRVDFGVTGGSSHRGRILYANAANTLNGAAGDRMEFFTNNDLSNSAILITSDNKIGIGSAIPQQTLEVNSATANSVSLNTTYAGGPNISFKVNGTIKSYIGSGGGFSLNGDGDDLALRGTDNILFDIAGTEKVRITSGGNISINNSGTNQARLDLRQASDHPAFNIGHPDGSFYRYLGAVGPNATDGTTPVNARRYLHVRLRTVWNDESMSMFRILGYFSYSQYAESYVGMYRYNSGSYRTNPYGQIIANQGNKAVIHSIYNTTADPGYLVIVLDSASNYLGYTIEHIGAGAEYANRMQEDLEIIDTKRSTVTSAQW